MTILQSIILGIIQGLTELLPVSSSAHLTIVPWILKWTESAAFRADFVGFDVALHFGTLLAIGLFFFKDWIRLIKGGYKYAIKKEKTMEGRMFWYIVLATIPGGIIGFILDKYFEDVLTKPIIIPLPRLTTALRVVMGIILYIIDKKSPSEIDYEDMTLKQTFLIGLSQALAFIPGVSRSGITVTVGRAMKIKRESAARYSFMLSTPIVLGATIFKLKDFVFGIPFFVGVIVSFLVGLFVIRYLLEYLRKGSFKGFAIYRIIAGLAIILIVIARSIS